MQSPPPSPVSLPYVCGHPSITCIHPNPSSAHHHVEVANVYCLQPRAVAFSRPARGLRPGSYLGNLVHFTTTWYMCPMRGNRGRRESETQRDDSVTASERKLLLLPTECGGRLSTVLRPEKERGMKKAPVFHLLFCPSSSLSLRAIFPDLLSLCVMSQGHSDRHLFP